VEVVDAVEAPGGLADRLEASVWRIELPGVAPGTASQALRQFLTSSRIEVQRRTKSGMRTFDARGAVLAAQVVDPPKRRPGQDRGDGVAQVDPVPCAILQLVVRHTTPAVRPDDILAALRSQADLAPPSPPRMTRLAQGPLDEVGGSVADPLTADRGVGGA